MTASPDESMAKFKAFLSSASDEQLLDSYEAHQREMAKNDRHPARALGPIAALGTVGGAAALGALGAMGGTALAIAGGPDAVMMIAGAAAALGAAGGLWVAVQDHFRQRQHRQDVDQNIQVLQSELQTRGLSDRLAARRDKARGAVDQEIANAEPIVGTGTAFLAGMIMGS